MEEKLFAAGALDVFRTSIAMKKGRLGVKLSVLCAQADQPNMERLLFLETPTIGLRAYPVEKTELKRDFADWTFEGHSYRVKRVYFQGEALRYKLEYEDLKRGASLTGEPFHQLKHRLEMALEAEERWKRL